MRGHRFEKLEGGFRWVPVELPDAPDVPERDEAGEELLLKERLLKLGAPLRHVSCKPEFVGDWAARLQLIDGMMGTGFTLGLIGARGNGKTQMGVWLMKFCLRSGKSARYTTAAGFFMEIRACFKRDTEHTEEEIVKKYRLPNFLVIDEIGKRSDSDWENTMLFELLNKRYADQTDTLLIANLSPAEFGKTIGASISSRMSEAGGIIECDWESFR